jgi:hypothetical protein
MPAEPMAARPHMPDYGIDAGTDGLLPWSWALERIDASRTFWLATSWPDGRPHVMPVWAVWDGTALLVSCGLHARKARNLFLDPRCAITTEDGQNPVVLECRASVVDDDPGKQRYLELVNAKYATDYQMDFLDPATTAVFRLAPVWAFGLSEEAFTTSPTRWQLA